MDLQSASPLGLNPELNQPLPLGALDGLGSDQRAKEQELVGKINGWFQQWRSDRRPHEIQWFLNAAFIRGQHWVQWNEAQGSLEVTAAAPHRIRLAINHILSKVKMRQARFLQNRFEPYVIPASLDQKDKLDAKASQGSIRYTLAKENAEKKYRGALNWANTAGRGYWWFYWDPSKLARVEIPAGAMGPHQLEPILQDAPLGDICLEVGSPFEVLVQDPGAPTLADQPRIMRVKVRPLEEVQARYPEKAAEIKADAGPHELFQYQRQIANLATRAYAGNTGGFSMGGPERHAQDHVVVKELFEKPTPLHPKGRYAVVAGGVLLRMEEELPYGFWDMPNPYPVVEFPDLEMAGQYWVPAMVEQLIVLNKEYNLIRSKAAEQVRLQAHPKVIVSQHCKFPANAYNSEAGEVIRVLTPPNMPVGNVFQILRPENIAADAWRHLDIIRGEMDTIPNLYPSSAGDSTGTESGFQVNLLQEATNSVHAPDIRNHEMAWEEACRKIRRMQKLYYSIPRLVSIRGEDSVPEVLEFSQNNIDEHAEIRIFTGNALSSSPAVRTKQVLEMFGIGVLGNQANPKTAMKALKAIDMEGIGELQQDARRDEEQAHLENARFAKGATFQDLPPQPWDNHELHWDIHTAEFKSPSFESWPPERKRQAILHAVYHAKYVNPTHAFNLAMELGLQELMPLLQPLVMPPSPGMPPGGQPGAPQDMAQGPPPPGGAPPQGPPVAA